MKQKVFNPSSLLIFVFTAIAIFAVLAGSAQNVKVTQAGNYVALTTVKDSTSAKQTDQTFTDTKGNVYPVMVSKNGKLFVIRTSKTGNKYNYYLKP